MIQSTKARIIAVSMLLMLAGTSASLARDTGIPIVWDPVLVTTGTLAGSTVTVTGAEDPALVTADVTGHDFLAAPLSTNATVITYETESDMTAVFSPPVNNLLLYVIFWRGFFGGPGIVTYDFDQPFTVLSGMSHTQISNGNTRLSIPDVPGIFEDGILEFSGPVNSITVETDSDSHSFQDFTFGILNTTQIPTLSEWGMITMSVVLGIIGFMVVRRRQAVA